MRNFVFALLLAVLPAGAFAQRGVETLCDNNRARGQFIQNMLESTFYDELARGRFPAIRRWDVHHQGNGDRVRYEVRMDLITGNLGRSGLVVTTKQIFPDGSRIVMKDEQLRRMLGVLDSATNNGRPVRVTATHEQHYCALVLGAFAHKLLQ